ncbi:MAG TPA: hypothetical protein VHD39_03580 [Acidimicrobiales bacterium]|nr:hypothetical protein [Acidimicrobiales bacterium]
MDLLATDPGAWNIIGWILLLAVGGAVVLWLVSTLLLRGGSREPVSPVPPSDSAPH